MKKSWRAFVNRLTASVLDDEDLEKLEQLKSKMAERDTGFGYDIFGAEYESIAMAVTLMNFFYKKYFRVDSYGHENIPKEGGIILASNHSGIVPTDGAMICLDCIKKLDPPRMPRGILQDIYGGAFTKDLMSRIGQVLGVRGNFEVLLKQGEAVLVFPEGGWGNSKPFPRRYKLMPFNVGHVELSIQNKAPIVPIGVVGAEEQNPIIYNWRWMGKKLKSGPFPVTLTWPLLGPIGLWPLPTKYYIYYGEPFRFWEEDPDACSKAEVITDMAGRVRASVQKLLDDGVAQRPSVFFRA